MTELVSKTPKFSVFILAKGPRREMERSIARLLETLQPQIEIEILVITSAPQTEDSLLQAFPEALRSGRVRIIETESYGDLGRALQAAADAALGRLFAFVQPGDLWRADGWLTISEHLDGHELIATHDDQTPTLKSHDWLGSFLRDHRIQPSSLIIKRSAWDAMDGAGFAPPWLDLEYHLLLRGLVWLHKTHSMKKFYLSPKRWVDQGARRLGAFGPLVSDDPLREPKIWLARLQALNQLPIRYWSTLGIEAYSGSAHWCRHAAKKISAKLAQWW